MFTIFLDMEEFRPIEITDAWLCVRRKILVDKDTINDHTLLRDKNFLSAVLSSVLKEKIKILNPINGVFTATVHFNTILSCRTWSLTATVEQDNMNWVALQAGKLMSQVWRRDAWKKLCLI